MTNNTEILEKLEKLLKNISPGDIYRTIHDPEGNILAHGDIPVQQHLVDDYCKVDFKDKTVIDLGCNFGLFSRLATELGAKHVTGLDYLPEVVEGATLLASLYGYKNISYQTFNIEKPDRELGLFDIAILVEFFGKSNIRKQKIEGLLNFIRTLSNTELLIAFRPINRIDKDLRMTQEAFSQLYPGEYTIDGSFYLINYIHDFLGDSWQMKAVSNYDNEFSKNKLLFHCQRIA